jgi:hypothetical protein
MEMPLARTVPSNQCAMLRVPFSAIARIGLLYSAEP